MVFKLNAKLPLFYAKKLHNIMETPEIPKKTFT